MVEQLEERESRGEEVVKPEKLRSAPPLKSHRRIDLHLIIYNGLRKRARRLSESVSESQ